jgi:polygalacturonase
VLPAATSDNGLFDVTRFGAVADGRTSSTSALQRAIDAAAKTGGGMVILPPGNYLSGALFLRNHVHLYLSPGATLLASDRPEDFPPIKGREEGVERNVHASLITGVDLEDVSVTGPGILDGQGAPWWKADEVNRKMRLDAKVPREAEEPAGAPLRWPRPRMINFVRCRNVLVDGVTLRDGAGVNIHLLYCQDVVVNGITSFQKQHVRSSEAVIVDSSKRVRITGCHISSGADGVGIKSGYNEDGRRVGIASEDILISHCNMIRTSSGVVVGSETSGGVRNVVVSNCTIHDCLSGIRIRAPRGRGGVVENVRVTNVVIDHAEEMGIKVSHYFDSIRSEGRYIKSGPTRGNMEIARSRKAPIDEGTPTFRDFTFSGITLTRAREVALLEGLPERFIRGVVFEDITAAKTGGGISCTLAGDITISNFAIDALEGPAVDAREIERLEVYRLKCPRVPAEAPLIWMDNVARAFVHGCNVGEGGRSYDWLQQEQCREVALVANNVPVRPGPGK